MNKIEKGKAGLIGLGISLIIVGVLSFLATIAFIILSAVMNRNLFVFVIFAIICGVLCIPAIIIGITLTWTGSSLKATNGSLKEDNLGIGTANMLKCPKCGVEVKQEFDACPNCGANLKQTKVCPECNAVNETKNTHCVKCGKEF